MEVQANKVDNANVVVSATILQSVVNDNVDSIAKKMAKDVKLPGFRQGKVPVSAVKKQYGERLIQDAESEALRAVVQKAIEDLKIDQATLLGDPHVSKYDKTDNDINVEIKLSLRPEVSIEDVASCIPAFEKPQISDEDITKRIEELAVAQAPMKSVEEDRGLQEGDHSVIDFEGSIDGEVFEGGTAQNFSLTIGSKQFIEGFEDQMIGMKKGEERTISVTFPENYGKAEFAGKPAEFKVLLHAIQEKEVQEINDALAQKMLPGEENATVELLKEKVKEQLEMEALRRLYNEGLKQELLKNLVEKTEFDVPEVVIEQEIDIAVNNKARSMSKEEIEELQQSEDKIKELRESMKDEAKESVKATFIIDELAKKENIQVNEQEVMQTIYYEAMQLGQDPGQIYERYKESNMLPAVQMAIAEDKVLSKILDDASKEG